MYDLSALIFVELTTVLQNFLPGLEDLDVDTFFINVTYPRFLQIPNAKGASPDLLMEFRVGQSGEGDDWLYHYTPFGNWTLIGRYLEVSERIPSSQI